MSLHEKRINFVNGDSNSSEDETCEEIDYYHDDENEMPEKLSQNKPKRKPTCFSKNAMMARENRIRKKLYVSKLESDVTSLRRNNKKLSLIVDKQSSLITDMKNEIKYLKSVIANSSDISKLIRNIHQSSGMSVSSSLDEKSSLKNCYIPKLPQPVGRKTAHPWEESTDVELECSENLSNPDDFSTELFKDLELPLKLPDQDLLNDLLAEQVDEVPINSDHNYTLVNNDARDNNDVGVCLHVSKHHVSLEFCSSCSEKAYQAWVG